MTAADPESLEQKRRPASVLDEVERLDVGAYAAVARTPTPTLDVAMARLSRAADYSKISLAAAGLLAVAGGRAAARPTRRTPPRAGSAAGLRR